MQFRQSIAATFLAPTVLGLSATPLRAETMQPAYAFELPAQDLGASLRAVGRLSGTEIVFQPETVAGRTAAPVHGTMTAADAVARLLRHSGLAVEVEGGSIVIRGRSQAAVIADSSPNTPDIVVTGTHIRNAEQDSRVISATRKDIEDRGRTNLGEYVRDLPQNFGGGQNPTVAGLGVQGGSENLASTSAPNLRGLGPDATLTLINGHRVAYDGALQGIDISAIPLAALDRIDVVADGSSALYGSDAVGGVVNVVLRKDFSGLWTSARLAGTTDGGAFQQQYDAVTGIRGQRGGFMIAADFTKSTELTAGQRSFTQSIDRSATLIPSQKQYSGVFSGHRRIGSAIELLLDAQYSRRDSHTEVALSSTSGPRSDGNVYNPMVASYSVTPSIKLSLPGTWQAVLSGTYSRSLTEVPGDNYSGGALVTTSNVFYDNRLKTVEMRGDGTLFNFPGGSVGLALGAGYRRFSLQAKSHIDVGSFSIKLLDIDRAEDVAYGYGEVSIPLFGPNNRVAFIHTLKVTGAVRYERYAGIAGVASPKLGLIYRPVPDLTIKGNWGKSFKAPTFYERFRVYQALLVNAEELGATGADANRPILELAGGNGKLQPERATTWSITASYQPAVLPALQLEASYYDVRYRNRVVVPFTGRVGSVFSNPSYAQFVTFNPPVGLLDQLIAPAGSAFGLQNFTGAPYDPTTVYAVVDARSQNSAYQHSRGVDLGARYELSLANEGQVDLSASASYIDSERRLVVGQASLPAAGVVFTPTHWRAQGGAAYRHDNLTLSGFLHYASGVEDLRFQPETKLGAFVTADVIARISGPATLGVFANTDLTLAVSNLFNEKPQVIRTAASIDPPYDSTNYSSIGRSISLTLAKRW